MTLIVGFAPDKGDQEAVALAATLARSAGSDLRVVSVVPAPWPTPLAGGTDREYDAWSRERGRAATAQAAAVLAEVCPDLPAEAVAVPGRSIPAGLMAEAERIEASIIVVGSGHDGGYGHVNLSSTSDRLLHSSPVPVAVATRGYRSGPGDVVARATCAFRGDPHSEATLARAAEVCAEVGAALRVATFAVRGRTMYPPEVGVSAEDMVLRSWAEQAQTAQREAIAALPEVPVQVTAELATGGSWAQAVDRLEWRRDEVLVIGSSSTNPLARLFLGSSATKIVRHAPVPVIVVP